MAAEREAEAFEALRDAVWRGDSLDGPVSTLADLTWTADIARDGEWLEFTPDDGGDPKWNDRANRFYAGLAPWVVEGRIDVEGEDGEQWSYLYANGRVTQEGTNGWDGSVQPEDQST